MSQLHLNVSKCCLKFPIFVTNELSGFEISLVCIPCKEPQHSYAVCFVAQGFQMQAVRCYLDGTCT